MANSAKFRASHIRAWFQRCNAAMRGRNHFGMHTPGHDTPPDFGSQPSVASSMHFVPLGHGLRSRPPHVASLTSRHVPSSPHLYPAGHDFDAPHVSETQMPVHPAPPLFGSHASLGSSMHVEPSPHFVPDRPPHGVFVATLVEDIAPSPSPVLDSNGPPFAPPPPPPLDGAFGSDSGVSPVVDGLFGLGPAAGVHAKRVAAATTAARRGTSGISRMNGA
jgi:hypothetical protein